MDPETRGNNPDSAAPALECPYRTGVRMERGVERASCSFLGKLSGVEDASLLEVRRDACETCIKLPQPHEVRIHDVHASLLYHLAERVLERGGVPGCDMGKAVGIRSWAERNLKFDDGLAPVDREQLDRVGVATECVHFGKRIADQPESEPADLASHVCLHPDRERTTPRDCFACRDWSDSPEAKAPSLRALFPRLGPRSGPEVRRWAVGVTTTRRFQPTLAYCLDSLVRAGWTEPRIFADGAVDLAARHAGLPLSVREPRLGAWPNYYLSMVELLMREPHADAYLLVQDDVIFHDRENLRAFLEEEVLWPGPESDPAALPAFVSLYCPRSYTRDAPGWYDLDRSWVWGALAFVFPRESAKRFVRDEGVLGHRWSKRNGGCANIDVVIGEWASRSGLKTVFPTPSLAQHIGESSTLWPTARALGSRRAKSFAGDRSLRERQEN